MTIETTVAILPASTRRLCPDDDCDGRIVFPNVDVAAWFQRDRSDIERYDGYCSTCHMPHYNFGLSVRDTTISIRVVG